MPVIVITPPDPILTAAEAKARAPVLATMTDSDLDAAIAGAQASIEPTHSWVGAAFGEQTLELRLDCFPYGRELALSFPPVTAVTSVKYLDPDGVEQTLDSATYFVAGLGTLSPRLVLKPGQVWPQTLDGPEGVKVRYTAGRAADDPKLESAKKAIALKCAEMRSVALKDPTLRTEYIEGVVRRDYAVTAEAAGLTANLADQLLREYWVRG